MSGSEIGSVTAGENASFEFKLVQLPADSLLNADRPCDLMPIEERPRPAVGGWPGHVIPT